MTRTMKDSGVEWIGEIPKDWKTYRLKHLLADGKGALKAGPFGSSLKASDMQGSDIKVYNQRSVLDNDFEQGEEYISLEKFEELKGFKVDEGDLLITTRGTIGKTAIVPQGAKKGILHPCLMGMRLNSKLINTKLISKIFNDTNLFLEQLKLSSNATTIEVIYTNNLSEVYVPVAPLTEQQAIADYLDKKCVEIDAVINSKQEQNRLLKEQRQSIIYEAVTKGLDKNAPMKDSGVEWIGKIPKDWGIWKLKHIVSTKITDGPHTTPQLLEDGVPFVSAESIKETTVNMDLKRGYISQEDHKLFCEKCKPQRNDIFMVKSGATTGAIGIVETDVEFSIWSPLALIRCKEEEFIQRYVFYSMLCDSFRKQVELFWNYGTQQNIGMNVIENLIISIPERNTQQSIVYYLDNKCAELDQLIQANITTINELKEYRQSVIFEAVTGKMEIG